MVERIVGLFTGMPREFVAALLSMLPITELRGAIPWALASPPYGGGLGWQQAFLYCVLGNLVPIVPLLLLIEKAHQWLARYAFWDRFFEKMFARTRRRGKVVEKYKAIGLTLFVGIPLPGTGAWTGALAAFVFGIPFRYAFPAIVAGVVIAGVLVTLASMGVIGVLKMF
ncbi:MAG: small multi-drug export protein [Calditrichaeota bacterium]|nr:small multi-drug export protein [Calditrichota bacterium]